MKLTVYLAGPIFNQTDTECKDWREYFKSDQHFCWLDPMDRDYRGTEDDNVTDIVENDKADILIADCVVANVNTPSAGTSMEILHAWLHDIPVVSFTNGKVSPWIRYHSSVVVLNEQQAFEKLRTIYIMPR